MSHLLPTICPSCQASLKITELNCEKCETVISGQFKLAILGQLSSEEQEFILSFVKSSGSLKEMAKQRNLSYPTVRNYLDDLIAKIEKYTP